MFLDKLKKLEDVLAQFKERFDLVKSERDSLKGELEELNKSMDLLKAERDEIRSRIDSLLDKFKNFDI